MEEKKNITPSEIMEKLMNTKVSIQVDPSFIKTKKGIISKKIIFVLIDPEEGKEKEIIIEPEEYIDIEKVFNYVQRLEKTEKKQKEKGKTKNGK